MAEPRCQEGQTASSARDSGPSEVEILRQTVARLEKSIQHQQSQQQHLLHQGQHSSSRSFFPPGWGQGPSFGAYGSTPFTGYGVPYPGAQFGFSGYGFPGQAETECCVQGHPARALQASGRDAHHSGPDQVKVPDHRRQWACACRDHGSVYKRLNEYRIADFQYKEVRKLPLLS